MNSRSKKVGLWHNIGGADGWVEDRNIPVLDRNTWARLHRKFPAFTKMVVAHGYQHAWRYRSKPSRRWEWIFRLENKKVVKDGS